MKMGVTCLSKVGNEMTKEMMDWFGVYHIISMSILAGHILWIDSLLFILGLNPRLSMAMYSYCEK